MAAVCFICEGTLEEGVLSTVKEKGLQTLRQSSIKRKDEKHQHLEGVTTIVVHLACRKQYVNDRRIAAYLSKMNTQNTDGSDETSCATRLSSEIFAFHSHCCLCGEEITDEFLEREKRKSPRERIHVYSVSKPTWRDSILNMARRRGDEWGSAIILRIDRSADLVALKAKHHDKCLSELSLSQVREGVKRSERKDNIGTAMQYIYSYLEEHSDECQFMLCDLINEIKGEYRPDVRTVQAHLQKKYGDDILIVLRSRQSPVVCFRNTGYNIISDTWYLQRNIDSTEERRRIVQTAAEIVLEDIRSKVYELNNYPPSDDFLQDLDSDIPETLRVFLNTVVVEKKKGDLQKWKNKSTALAHCLIAAARPKSFLSPLQIGVASLIYKTYGSRHLIDILSALGFCASYNETKRFEVSAVMRPEPRINDNAFCQFVYDNADFNTQTLDGYHTFHAMGGIQCVTPASALPRDTVIARVSKLPAATVVGKFGEISLQTYQPGEEPGLRSIHVLDLDILHPMDEAIMPSTADLMWLFGKWTDRDNIPGWSGFMETVTRDLPYEQSVVLCLPFLNAPPTDYDTIFTSLLSASAKCQALGQQTCFVTFDLPLYIKASEIIATYRNDSRLQRVVPRLGGFHLLMSFMGSIGYIMSGSGLKELLNSIYALNSLEKMLSGHAYSRALRAHMLTHQALTNLVMAAIDFEADEKTTLQSILANADQSVINSVEFDNNFQALSLKFQQQLRQFKENGATAKLWVQYCEMVTLIKLFIEAERTGNWHLHLNTIHKMIPFFYASGHFPYGKASQLYLQNMYLLPNTMEATEYERLTTGGAFTIRRSDKFWCGTWPDMVIEQSLMRTMKVSGGLTHGRGVEESILKMWTLGTAYLHNVCDAVEQFCQVTMQSSEQHVQLRPARIKRDNADVAKLLTWFEQHPPFPNLSQLISLSTGIIGDNTINCHMARLRGMTIMDGLVGANFQSIKCKRADRVRPLSILNTAIRVDKEVVPINPLLLFQRISIAKQCDAELEHFLTYELAPFPLALFSEDGMRKGTKSTLYKLFQPCNGDMVFGNIIHVIDGGYLLHRVIWPRSETFASICRSYVNYIQSHYDGNAVIVFDGYPANAEERSTKYAERYRRSRKHGSTEYLFSESIIPNIAQEKFLAHDKNKQRFIVMLTEKLKAANFTVTQAVEDADLLIVNTAISMAGYYDSVVIVGEDVDLLVLLTAHATSANVFLLKPSRGKTSQELYNMDSLQNRIIVDNILFLHAFSGCDTTSCFCQHGKIKFYNLLCKQPALSELLLMFKQKDANPDTIANIAKRFVIGLYGYKGKQDISLNTYRHQCFIKSAYKTKFNIASLPPTEAAVLQHALRTYLQVQQWCGNDCNPLEWGWKRGEEGLLPISTLEPPAPQKLLKLISCSCKTGCSRACGCRRAGLKCSIICTNCNSSCTNMPEPSANDEDEDEELDEQEE